MRYRIAYDIASNIVSCDAFSSRFENTTVRDLVSKTQLSETWRDMRLYFGPLAASGSPGCCPKLSRRAVKTPQNPAKPCSLPEKAAAWAVHKRLRRARARHAPLFRAASSQWEPRMLPEALAPSRQDDAKSRQAMQPSSSIKAAANFNTSKLQVLKF